MNARVNPSLGPARSTLPCTLTKKTTRKCLSLEDTQIKLRVSMIAGSSRLKTALGCALKETKMSKITRNQPSEHQPQEQTQDPTCTRIKCSFMVVMEVLATHDHHSKTFGTSILILLNGMSMSQFSRHNLLQMAVVATVSSS